MDADLVLKEDLPRLIEQILMIERLLERWELGVKGKSGLIFQDLEVNGRLPNSLMKHKSVRMLLEILKNPFYKQIQAECAPVIKADPIEIDIDAILLYVDRLKEAVKLRPESKGEVDAVMDYLEFYTKQDFVKNVLADYEIYY